MPVRMVGMHVHGGRCLSADILMCNPNPCIPSLCRHSHVQPQPLHPLSPQISWMLLQAAHLPGHAARRALLTSLRPAVIERFLSSVAASPALLPGIKHATARNCCWALLILCDVPASAVARGAVAVAAARGGPLHPGHPPLLTPSGASQEASEQAAGDEDVALQLGLQCGQEVFACGLLDRLAGPMLRTEFGLDVGVLVYSGNLVPGVLQGGSLSFPFTEE